MLKKGLKMVVYTYIVICCCITPLLVNQNKNLKELSASCLSILRDTNSLNSHLIKKMRKLKVVKCTATAYTASRNECDKDVSHTAIMRKPIPGRTIAVSRDLKRLLGKKVYSEKLGVRVVEDLMNHRYKNRIDILFSTKEDAFKFGKQSIKLVVLD